MTADREAPAAVDAAFREEWGRVVATLIASTGDWDLAEECAQDAFAQALTTWPRTGVPAAPGAWLTTTARNRAVDVRRRRATLDRKLREEVAVPAAPLPPPRPDTIRDERLELIFTCAHPALPLEARVALTLRTLAGLTTEEIARAFLVTEAAMAKRLTRAKAKIAHAGIPFRVPPPALLPERTGGVLTVLYLLFNAGYAAGTDADGRRTDLCATAIHLVRALAELLPTEPEARGLLALMLLHHARRGARTDARGALVTLEDQDRACWDRATIEEGVALLDTLVAPPGPYALQARIAAAHATAARASDTDWHAIAADYARLDALTPSPVVRLNRAVAVAMADGPRAGLELLDGLDDALPGYHLLPAARADLLERDGRHPEAHEHWRAALALAPTDADRRAIEGRLDA